ncbi:class II aaRS and biotin synthetase [Trametes polyzona]|nr:class II aaRS and biotin synthetase [Trametes polyzona]
MNVLVYSGSLTSPPSLSHTLSTLRTVLLPNYAVQPVAPQSLAVHPWTATCSLLVFPSFLPDASPASALPPAAASEVRKYVERGGRVLFLGASVRTRASRPRTSLARELARVSLAESDEGILTLSDEQSKLTFTVLPNKTSGSDIVGEPATPEFPDEKTVSGLLRAPGSGIDLAEVSTVTENPVVLAKYKQSEGLPAVAGVKATIGEGLATFWNAHLEYSPREEIAASILTAKSNFTQEDLTKAEEGRISILRKTLSELGLIVPEQAGIIARPTPQVFTSAPWRHGIARRILKELEAPDLAALGENGYELKDSNDTFIIHPASSASAVFAVSPDDRYPNQDPATWNPKHIVLYDDGEVPPREFMPRFDLKTFYAALKEARKTHGRPEEYPNDGWGIGEALLYGDVVTSTQTLFEKNTRLMTSLPTPLVSLTSSQLAGRGRGGNIWLSPPGCLQFSILLRAPFSALPPQKVVFAQYLVALAVVEACRDEGVLGVHGAAVRIKWPNDIYVVVPETGEMKKVCGILVNTSFGAGKVDLIAGCGLNVLNPPPIMSLAQLVPPGSERLPTKEGTLAAIVTRFEAMWATFLAARGSFEPFMDLYLDRWLHSDQLVTLTTVSPPRKVRIVGITPEYGLLRTTPERDARGGGARGGEEYIDLQPDGNSFDIMAGLIKTKT